MTCLYETKPTGELRETSPGRKLAVIGCVHKNVGGDVTRDDCKTCRYRMPVNEEIAENVVIKNHLCPGDVVVLSAAIRSLHLSYPSRYRVWVDVSYPAVFKHSPDVVTTGDLVPPGAKVIEVSYPLINESNSINCHFMYAYTKDLGEKLGIPLELKTNRPHLFLGEEEKSDAILKKLKIQKPFFVINAGFKQDYPTKFWGQHNYQELVHRCIGDVAFVQVGDANGHHPLLQDVYHAYGRTTLRELISLCWHAEGGVGPSTLIQHIFAALQKPYVCLLGGREPLPWVTYPLQTTLHTFGALPCCKEEACWKAKLEPGHEDSCLFPLPTIWATPKCMGMITPAQVAQVISNLRKK